MNDGDQVQPFLLKVTTKIYALLVLLVWISGTAVARENDCAESPLVTSAASPGRSMLGEGIALFDAKKFKQAERALQAALFAGLGNTQERASAHKYLAFVSCSQKEWSRCEAEFQAAFAARPSFSLDAYEIQGTPWRDAYLRARSQWGGRCAGAFSGSTSSLLGPASQSFALNSSVVVSITPLNLAGAVGNLSTSPSFGVRSQSDRPDRSGINVRLKVFPWAFVNVDGRRLGVTPPLTELSLPAGTRTVELTNPGFESIKRVVEIINGNPVTITHDFDSR